MAAARPHLAARVSDRLNRLNGAVLRRLRWRPSIVAYPGYGQAGPSGWVRVLGRVLWAPPSGRATAVLDARGWRRFLTAPVPDVAVEVHLPGAPAPILVRSGRGGYVDAVLPASLPAGTHAVELAVAGSAQSTPVSAEITVLARRPQVGVLSDIDDTILITHLPRPLLALWNTFVLRESARRPVPGMARLQAAPLVAADGSEAGPASIVVYLSTGPWNVVPALAAFLRRHDLRPGPMLMTDWGPTNTGWFRSGRDHKAQALRRLAEELPQVRWILVGDDGQHDPQLYADFVGEHPEQVVAVAIRRLTGVEQVLGGHPERAGTRRGGRRVAGRRLSSAPPLPWVSGADGDRLVSALQRAGVLAPPPGNAVVPAVERSNSDIK